MRHHRSDQLTEDRFEYEVQRISTRGFLGVKFDAKAPQRTLTEQGRAGWELVCNSPLAGLGHGATGALILVFKRRL